MTETIDQQFIEYIVKALVGQPDKVKVERTIDERGVLLQLYVDPEDLGRVIGRNGATAKSIRTLLRALGVKNDARYNLKIVDTGEGRPAKEAPAAEEIVPESSAEQPAEPTEAVPTAAVSDDQTGTSQADSQAQTDEEAKAESEPEEDRLKAHRDELKELTGDLDI